ncbi:MAG: alpha-N-arabinofuranosidase [Acidobacteriaceae bacterium]
MKRREFLKSSALVGSAMLFTRGRAFAEPSDSRIEVLLDEPIGTISPNIYGQFTEHLGGVIYDGVWVGEDSKIPNIGGIRKELVEKLRDIKVPVIRWPGGCFADSYDWRDGIGPRNKRPRRTNFWVDDPDAKRLKGNAVQLYEDNAFGTDEFIHFCRLSGAEPYLAANLRSLTPLAFDHWVEYCNSPAGSTTLADQRAANGSRDPYNVRYWGVGNESWGCGGNFTPEDYAMEFRRFTTWVPSYGVDLAFIGSGPNNNDLDWTRRFFEKNYTGRPYFNPHFFGWSVHYYTWNLSRGRTEDWVAGKGDALNFDTTDWYELLREGNEMEQIVTDQWAVLGEYDRHHHVKLVIDEYGPWYRPGTEIDPTDLLGQQVTIRDAVHTAMTLDIFNRNAEKVGVAACAQLVNCLNALFLTHEDKFTVTPNYHVFDMYAAHQGAQAVRAQFSAPMLHYDRNGKRTPFWGLNGSASMNGKTVTLTVVNPSTDAPRETEIALRGGNIASAVATTLASNDIHAHNTFEHQGVMPPKTTTLTTHGSTVTAVFPPASVSKITVTLA